MRKIPLRKSIFLTFLGVLTLIVVGSYFAIAAANIVPDSSLDDDLVAVDPNQFKPPECNGINLTNMIFASGGNTNGTSGNDLIFGTAGADTINGRGGADCIVGDDGNDELIGGAGNDVILGEGGNNVLRGRNGNDTLYGAPLMMNSGVEMAPMIALVGVELIFIGDVRRSPDFFDEYRHSAYNLVALEVNFKATFFI